MAEDDQIVDITKCVAQILLYHITHFNFSVPQVELWVTLLKNSVSISCLLKYDLAPGSIIIFGVFSMIDG